MKYTPCILVSQARSRSSMLMDMLERGGVPCEYSTNSMLEKTKKGQYRNPHGFFEIGNGVHTWTKCSKVLGTSIINQIPLGIKIVYLVRGFEQVCKSHLSMNPLWRNRNEVAEKRNQIEAWLTTREFIKIRSEDMIANPRAECERLKEFLSPEVDFDVDAAIQGIDNSLIVIR